MVPEKIYFYYLSEYIGIFERIFNFVKSFEL